MFSTLYKTKYNKKRQELNLCFSAVLQAECGNIPSTNPQWAGLFSNLICVELSQKWGRCQLPQTWEAHGGPCCSPTNTRLQRWSEQTRLKQSLRRLLQKVGECLVFPPKWFWTASEFIRAQLSNYINISDSGVSRNRETFGCLGWFLNYKLLQGNCLKTRFHRQWSACYHFMDSVTFCVCLSTMLKAGFILWCRT